jgi:hypothetical protein
MSVATVRGFWDGAPLSPYQLVCLRSFVDHGFRVEVFTYDRELLFPSWVRRRDANEILPATRILQYPPPGFGHGSPALHSNLFRYAMLHALGGWWIDLDVVLLSPNLPTMDVFASATPDGIVVNSVLRFPVGHPLLAEAVERCRERGENCVWGDTGSALITPLMAKYQLSPQPLEATYPVHYDEVPLLFDPARRAEVEARCADRCFLHLFNEIWRSSGLDQRLGPPLHSFLDRLFLQHDPGAEFPARMSSPEVERAIALMFAGMPAGSRQLASVVR